jgi:hypothetical protein
MSHIIRDYPLTATTRQEIEMPWGSKFLKLAATEKGAFLWMLVDATQTGTSKRVFHLYETDEVIPNADTLQYLGTFAMETTGGMVPLHCFESTSVLI